jgi:hypothetical protein
MHTERYGFACSFQIFGPKTRYVFLFLPFRPMVCESLIYVPKTKVQTLCFNATFWTNISLKNRHLYPYTRNHINRRMFLWIINAKERGESQCRLGAFNHYFVCIQSYFIFIIKIRRGRKRNLLLYGTINCCKVLETFRRNLAIPLV